MMVQILTWMGGIVCSLLGLAFLFALADASTDLTNLRYQIAKLRNEVNGLTQKEEKWIPCRISQNERLRQALDEGVAADTFSPGAEAYRNYLQTLMEDE